LPYISLINAAESLQSSSKASGIIQKLGGPWPPPTSIRRAIAPRQWTEVRGWCTPKHPLLHPIGSPGSNYEQTQFVFPTSVSFPQSVDAVVAIVKDAEANQQRVHAYGSLWSFSDCALTPDVLVDTSSLNKERPNLDPAFNGNQPPHVYHVEAGITIHELYTNLNNKGLALETMGGAS
jgi:FAD/FMN-containing dehydrogenase